VETTWTLKTFSDLTNLEVYQILQLRNEVFIVEQNCPYQDCDEKDFKAHHLCAWQQDHLVAYARLLPPGIAYPGYASIGRVLTAKSIRRQNLGNELMRRAVREIYTLFGRVEIAISAQYYLKNFYESFRFVQTGEVYLEDDIPHVRMELSS
jgi:ElaA protein